MKRWSEFQPEEYLEATRKSFLANEYAPVITSRCGIKDNSSVLELGCGTGAFSRYLSQSVEHTRFTGVDLDEVLLEYMNERSYLHTNSFQGIKADALSLPFEENTFDAVCSHTFLSCVSQPKKAMKEMIRVCKKNGIVSSITAMSWENECAYQGEYPEEEMKWMKQYQELYKRMYQAYYVQFGGLSMAMGVPLNQIPLFFKKMGLEDVSILSVGRAFSLSDASIEKEEKRQYILNYYIGEKKKLDQFCSYFFAETIISKKYIDEFSDLLVRWKEYWLSHLDDNEIWEWTGGAQLLVCGRKG